jgi:hypothetical protein
LGNNFKRGGEGEGREGGEGRGGKKEERR